MKFPGLLCATLVMVSACFVVTSARTREDSASDLYTGVLKTLDTNGRSSIPARHPLGRAGAFSVGSPAFSLTVEPFDFNSGFWINLHHFLYMSALPLVPGSRPAPLPEMPQSERETWDEAVGFYRQHMVQLDFVGDDQLQRMDSYLTKIERATTPSGDVIGKNASKVLISAAPIYDRYWWPQHDAANQFWIKAVQPLVTGLGPAMRTQLTQAYDAKWPDQLIRVDISVYANWGGAYTNVETGGQVHTVMSSTDPGYQGFAAIEMLFHEASHAMVDGETGKLGEAIQTQAKAHGIPVPDQLWHALIFYSAGEFVRQDLSHVGVREYRPYAEKQGLWERSSFRNYGSVLSVFWRAHMDGKLSLNDAVSQIMNALAITQSSARPAP